MINILNDSISFILLIWYMKEASKTSTFAFFS
jgi:hypothetical protein